jgi:hypothetical protein
MSADTVTRLSLPPRSPEIGAGHELAFEMFDELLGEDGSGTPADAALLDRNYRHGRPYRDVVADYLERAHKAGPEVERGFTMILSDLVAVAMQGSCPDAYYFDRMMRRGQIAAGPRLVARREKARSLRLRRARRSRHGLQ